MKAAVEQRVCQVVADVLGVSRQDVTKETSREEHASWDSVSIVNLVMRWRRSSP